MPTGDTIVALSTPPGESAIAVIRLSGPESAALAQAVSGRKSPLLPRQATFCKYLSISGKLLDEILLTYFADSRSFTGEAVLEIACHGNPLIIQNILEDLLARGCRPAEPGEFTRTAFLNGKMDLSQAEAVADLIHARSEKSIEVAQRQLHGSVGHRMSELTEKLLGIMARIEAYIDFPEEDLPGEDQSGPAADLRALSGEIRELIETQRYSALLHEGVKALIVGEPNVGKSSLINALVGSERSIVSELPGTTRDYVSAFIMLDSWRIEILDTAGLHEAADRIEQIGIHRTIEQSETADSFLLVLDSTAPSPTLPESLLSRMTPDNTLVIENKTDLEASRDMSAFLPNYPHLRLSLRQDTDLQSLRRAWLERIESSLVFPQDDGVIVNARHAAALTEAVDCLELALVKLREGELSELIAADLRDAVDSIGKVVGKVDNERMLDHLFQQFCIGK
ncbi:MAG: tRNA uridine-5-carboxymethylaminomethyl(34) synthesis GTPase MnmE [Opitutales bacterium]